MFYNETADGWHHYGPCLWQPKNMVRVQEVEFMFLKRIWEGLGSQAVSMTAQRQCDREGRWAGKKGAGGGGGLKETEMEKGVKVEAPQLDYHTRAPPAREFHLIWSIFLQILDHLLLCSCFIFELLFFLQNA